MKIDNIVDRYISKKEQKRLLILTSIFWMIGAAGVMVLAFAIPDLSSEWKISSQTLSSIISSTFMGMLLGALSSGVIVDSIGRKFGSLLYLLISVVFTFSFGFSKSLEVAIILRFLSGVGYGGLLPSVNTYLSEYTSIKLRGRYLVFLETSWAIGSIIIALFAVTIGNKFGWRWDFFIFIIGLFAIIPLIKEKETPKYIYKKFGVNGLKKWFNIKETNIEPLEETRLTFSSLFRKTHIKHTFLIIITWFVVSFVYYALFSWAPKIFVSQLGISVTKAKWFTFYMYVAQLPGYLSVAYFIEKWGRKPTLAIYFIGMGLSAFLLPLVSGNISFLLIMLIISFFTLGVWGLVYAYTPELFPTPMRGTANGTAGAMARVAGIIAPYFTGYFIDKSMSIALTVIAIFSILAGVSGIVLGTETKNKPVN
ncbi:MFS transporter [Thermosipho ferrireducens]|uniref:MFS transporter n=1 Tax=Thermosipho ferrireducens TaxID=2571116 RepID=A0ABX7S9A7_9BACT|nr:MFS transporter [Thermosipho ferrireducens]QTA37936.1 MFS transporter [Thermosipho ferrireducens]